MKETKGKEREKEKDELNDGEAELFQAIHEISLILIAQGECYKADLIKYTHVHAKKAFTSSCDTQNTFDFELRKLMKTFCIEKIQFFTQMFVLNYK